MRAEPQKVGLVEHSHSDGVVLRRLENPVYWYAG